MQSDCRQTTRTSTARQQAIRRAVFCCIALLALLMFVQAAHVHPVGSNSDQCPICVAMHSAAPVPAHTVVLTSTGFTESVSVSLPQKTVTELHYTLYKRPPPASFA